MIKMEIENKSFYNSYLNDKFKRFLNFIINNYNYKIKTYIVKDIKVKDNNTIDITAKRKYSIKNKTTNIDSRILDLYFGGINCELDELLVKDKISYHKLSDCLKNKKLTTIWYSLPKGETDIFPSSWQIFICNTRDLTKIIKIN
jgi:hypothetical protein